MTPDFQKITVLGAGVLGGSLALALTGSGNHTRLWARRPETVSQAAALGIPTATARLSEAVAGADLLILAVPVGAMPALLTAAIENGLPPGCLVTDVGSVKATPHRTLSPILQVSGNPFIGSHPMAGSEQNGLHAASRDLFKNAACILTNDDNAPAPAPLALDLERFWQSVGCRTSWMPAAAHDELVARISHLPHILSASAARVCLKDPSQGAFGGGGLRDTTRIAGGHPAMWSEILTENRDALLQPLRETLTDLGEILASLENRDLEQTQHWLATAKHHRDTLVNPT